MQFEGCVADHRGHSPWGRNGAAYSFDLCCMDSLNEVLKVYPPLKLKVFVGDITADMEGIMRSWLELQRKS